MSSDVYFYYLAGGYGGFKGLGVERLARYTRMFGLGQPTGIDLPGEANGNVPDTKWKQETFNEEWLTGDTYNFGIGQGFLVATPLQMARAVAAIANGGELLQPRVVREVLDAKGTSIRRYGKVVQRRLEVSENNLALVREGMRQAVATGTAKTAQVPGVTVAGKTGTAEFGSPLPGARIAETHGWFVGYAPADKPEIAVVVFLDQGNGAINAAPAAGKILHHYFVSKG
jgi:penicillin-binding protein 2